LHIKISSLSILLYIRLFSVVTTFMKYYQTYLKLELSSKPR
jgi:hypothetical protein